MLKKLCLFKIIILTLRHNSKVIAYQLIGFVKDENIEMVQFHGGWRGSTDDGNRRDAFQSE